MNRELIDRWCERGILGLVLAILVFGPLATGAVRTWEFLVLQALTMGTLLLWIVRLWFGESRRLLWTPVCWVVLLFVGYAIVRYLQADIEYVARQELIKVLVYACVFFVVLNHLHSQDSSQIVAYVLFALATCICFYAIYQFATDSRYVWNFIKPVQYLKRGTGTYICPNHLAGFLELLLPLGLTLLFMGRLSHVARILIGYASLMMLVGIGVSISRGGWIATGLSLAVLFAILLRNRNYRLPAILFLTALLVGGVGFVLNAKHSQERFQQMFTAGKLEDIRFRLWRPAMEMWKENLWLGAGPAHFDYRFRQFRPEDVQMRPDRVHNDYLNTLADWGIVGAALVASAFGVLFWGAFKTWKYVRASGDGFSSRKTNKAAWVLGASIGLLAILFHSVVDFNFHIPANAILAVTLMALLSSHLRFSTDRYWVARGWVLRLLTTAACVATIAYLGYQGVRRGREYRYLVEAKRLPSNSFPRAKVLEKAYAIEPMNFETTYQIGETYRIASFLGNDDYAELGEKAIAWFKRTRELHPYDGYNYLRYAMILDWLHRFDEAAPLMIRAQELDPNGYYIVAFQGWHCVQLAGDAERKGHPAQARERYTEAQRWFERSLRLKYDQNTIAIKYLGIVRRKLTELAEMK